MTTMSPRKPAQLFYATQVRFTPAQRDILAVLADARGVSISSVVRDAIDAYGERFVDDDGVTLRKFAEDGRAESFDPGDFLTAAELDAQGR